MVLLAPLLLLAVLEWGQCKASAFWDNSQQMQVPVELGVLETLAAERNGGLY